ncbi:ankyrin repeat and sterile alpha motif domain-containing protein 1B [Rhinatrema bivittatum]|uniref:ankyrin repeat and sterile alpha motif domain-containing protein 1B n=1 Tax=Rhinatrema bivittatum TaxID=194408 RepID=UPI00112DCF3B|nr:ankyrin repeat and sterile alpha motif domain-containing protein 1B [Rhinatrema bivittatum]
MGKEHELLEAARTGNVTLVEKLFCGKRGGGLAGSASSSLPLASFLSIWRGPSINCTDSSGYTALHHAALNGHKNVVLKLLQYEASANVADHKGCFPLHLAAWRGDADIVKILIYQGPSHSRVNEQNYENETALHCAAQYGHSDVAALLLQEHSDPTIRNNKLETPLDLAAHYGRLRVVKLLIDAYPNLLTCSTRKHTPLHLAACNGHRAVVQLLLQSGADVNCQTEKGTALHEAALFGKVDVVRTLIENGIDVTIKDGHGKTVLDILKEHPSQKSLQIVSLLQEHLQQIKNRNLLEEQKKASPLPGPPRAIILCPGKSPSRHVENDPVTGKLSRLLHEIKLCQEQDYSFEDLCRSIHSLDSLDEELEGEEVLECNKTPSSATSFSPNQDEEDVNEGGCGPLGFWEALTPCSSCRNLGFPSLMQEPDTWREHPVGSPEAAPWLSDLLAQKPCSLELERAAFPRGERSPQIERATAEASNRASKWTSPTPDCSPPSPDTALNNIVKVIRPQPKQRISLQSSFEVQRLNQSPEFFEVSSSVGYGSFTSNTPVSLNNDSPGIVEHLMEENGLTGNLCGEECSCKEELSGEFGVPTHFAGLLHGSSPSCESVEDLFHIYSTCQWDTTREEEEDPEQQGNSNPSTVPRNANHAPTPASREARGTAQCWVINSRQPWQRVHTLGIDPSVPKAELDLNLSKEVSKSESDLMSYPLAKNRSRGNSNKRGDQEQSSSQRTSFTSEWEEIDKIINSIDAGIKTTLEIPAMLSGPRLPGMTVRQWLGTLGLPQYEKHLLANGFDNLHFMGTDSMEDQDLLEIGILNSGHRQKILQAMHQLPKMRPVGTDGYNPSSVPEWLDSIELGNYTKSFLMNGFTSVDLVKKLWEIELISILKIKLLGHRKRILASLGERVHEDNPQKPPRSITLREPSGENTPPQLSPSLSQSTYTTGGSLDFPHIMMQDARRRRNENYFDDIPRSKLERQMAQSGDWGEPSLNLRPPNEAASANPVQYWQHHPEKLIFQACDYRAYYLGSMLVKDLRGTESTQDACSKMRVNCLKSTEQMKKVPTIILSVSYKGVKFIDALNKNIIAEHEIRNISCAAQDPEDLSTFAYITKDLKSSHHYCHVFTAFDVNLAYEIILTLGQAFEVAYQLALQARKGGHSSTLPESFENKPAKPIPKPRVSIRKSMQIDASEQKTLANLPWIVEPGQETKRGISTKYETTIF